MKFISRCTVAVMVCVISVPSTHGYTAEQLVSAAECCQNWERQEPCERTSAGSYKCTSFGKAVAPTCKSAFAECTKWKLEEENAADWKQSKFQCEAWGELLTKSGQNSKCKCIGEMGDVCFDTSGATKWDNVDIYEKCKKAADATKKTGQSIVTSCGNVYQELYNENMNCVRDCGEQGIDCKDGSKRTYCDDRKRTLRNQLETSCRHPDLVEYPCYYWAKNATRDANALRKPVDCLAKCLE